ncbi:hypothetical protein [Hymenobacter rubidus]|uniref:hypothetical protein n=1 Tax=Hymenobacter rubidus TaxID=1441626 RepID=UPI00191EC8CD|nr:hypothetical protein [Hymenobacter rubidus]
MIGLKVAAGWLVLAPGTITVDINSPFFNPDSVPGTITYPFGLPVAGNAQALNFPDVRAAQGDVVAPEPCKFYIDEQLRWVGSLVYLECDEKKGLYAYNFVADAADLQARIEGVTLPSLDLGRVPLQLVHNAADYALPCVRNYTFYGGEVANYGMTLNYYANGTYRPAGTLAYHQPIVPFLRLVPLLHRVLGAVGYALSGPWLDTPEAQAAILYSDRTVEQADGSLPADFAVNRHVPDLEVGALLVQLQKVYGLGYGFHPKRRELSIRALRDVIADPAYLDRTGGLGRSTAVTQTGWVLSMGLESDDELNKTLDTGWATLRVGNGKQTLSTEAGTLHVVEEPDYINPARTWRLPAVDAKGASLAFGVGDDSHCGLRLLYDRGLCPDSQQQLYPLATWDREDMHGNTVGPSTLHWDGEAGLYATWHRAWLDFLDRATTREVLMEFRVADLLTLDPARKELVYWQKYLWEKVSLSLKTTGRRLEAATFTYRLSR